MQTKTPHVGATYNLTLTGSMCAALGLFRLDAGHDCDQVAATYLPGYIPFTGAARR
jgi:hypothetical protein